MQPSHIAATSILALSCAFLAASCVLSPESRTEAEPAQAQSSSGTAPTGEAQEPLPLVSFEAKDFPFATVIPDDGKDEGGGWQQAKADLVFSSWVVPHLPRRWQCKLTVGMPLRTKYEGRVSPILAATLSAQVAEDAARAMDYRLPPGIFCQKLVDGIGGLFNFRHPKLGARVTKG